MMGSLEDEKTGEAVEDVKRLEIQRRAGPVFFYLNTKAHDQATTLSVLQKIPIVSIE